ncbi:MAG: hypothetical protein HGB36_09050 [Chlorobiaceae bacterium]|jgi:hypothetical protein|nr:hypothetical protein [Chlorobiaceae bacterium]
MFFHESMVIPSLYSREEQALLERWVQKAPDYLQKDLLVDSNKVAQISLFSVQRRLPQGLSIREDGSAIVGRKRWDCAVHMRNDVIFPAHLFEINWDDSQPGLSWPETYYATYLPGYDIYVVSTSVDSADTYGYMDLALGFFHKDMTEDVALKAGSVIQSWWQYLHEAVYKPVWKEFIKPGLIDAERAVLLRDEVWNKVGNPDSVVS